MEAASQIIRKAVAQERKHLLESESKTVCIEYGIQVTRFELAQSEAQAIKLAKQIGYPIVLKIVSPNIIHKSDVGGVVLDLKDEKDVRTAYRQILENVNKHNPNARIAGMLVQEMAPRSTEVIVGAIKDPQFGPTIMFGLGGIFVEVLKDLSFRVAPITEDEAKEMISEVKGFPLLMGYRNWPPADLEAIVKILLSTSKLLVDHEEIKELDLNPIMAYAKGAKAVDARIILE